MVFEDYRPGGGFSSSRAASRQVTPCRAFLALAIADLRLLKVVVAFSATFMLPDLPRTTTWLTEEEKVIAAWRLEADVGEDDWVGTNQQHPLHGLKLAVK